jgi:ATP-binding cassette subfamily B (MDR/TAP) protein 8
MELFRTLLMEKLEFFDRHSTTQLTSLISIELDALRSFVFGNVSRDRGLRAILEACGSVLVSHSPKCMCNGMRQPTNAHVISLTDI